MPAASPFSSGLDFYICSPAHLVCVLAAALPTIRSTKRRLGETAYLFAKKLHALLLGLLGRRRNGSFGPAATHATAATKHATAHTISAAS